MRVLPLAKVRRNIQCCKGIGRKMHHFANYTLQNALFLTDCKFTFCHPTTPSSVLIISDRGAVPVVLAGKLSCRRPPWQSSFFAYCKIRSCLPFVLLFLLPSVLSSVLSSVPNASRDHPEPRLGHKKPRNICSSQRKWLPLPQIF